MKGISVLTFVIGVGVGAAGGIFGTRTYFKTKYEKQANEDIASVVEKFSGRVKKDSPDEDSEKEKVAEFARNKPDINVYAKKLSKEGYTNYSNSETVSEPTENEVPKQEEINEDKTDKPYVISPDEFGEFYDYTQISLTFFSDHVLADENYEMVDDIDAIVGVESLNHFGEYEDDSVFVRNDRLKVDYEILLDQRKYSDVLKSKPYLMGAWDDDDDN